VLRRFFVVVIKTPFMFYYTGLVELIHYVRTGEDKFYHEIKKSEEE
jgi:hypothetical protein